MIVLTNTAQQRLRKASTELYFIGETGSVMALSPPLLYTCTLSRECLAGLVARPLDSAPHVESREEGGSSLWSYGLTPITRPHHVRQQLCHQYLSLSHTFGAVS